ncbi:MAG: glycoside hydrolase family 15 protein [Myxococcaceae bacterium]
MSVQPQSIGDYAVIGDGRSAALVSKAGAVDWLCWPRFDSPSVFAGILDRERGGFWRIAPRGVTQVKRHYLEDTNVLVTNFTVPGGRVRLTDLMPVCSEEEKRAGLTPEHQLLRIVDCEAPEAQLEIAFSPRCDYGRRPTRLRQLGRLGIRLEDRAQLYTLQADCPLHLRDDNAYGVARMGAGERLCFSLCFDSVGPAVVPPLGAHAADELERSVAWWQRWARRCTYDGPYREQVVRSVLALKLLSYAPSGAVVAAPTTSLPERLGGALNWDYRYCWLRDASLTVRALYDCGYSEEAGAFVSWLLHSTSLSRPELNVLYDVHGQQPQREQLLEHLDGYRGSRPVRIHNAAAGQLQLDTYGEVIGAVARIAGEEPLDRATQAMLRQFGDSVLHNWSRPDQGIWEPRHQRRQHTHSRLLCWVALDRLLAFHHRGLLKGLDAAQTALVREEVRFEIETLGWNPAIRAYTATLGGNTVDASLLLMSWYDFAPASDPRLRATFERIHERLDAGDGLIYRDEVSHRTLEGAFGICCFWAADHLALGGGSLEEAEAYLQRLLACANEVGLYGEEIDPADGQPLGNFPQAFTHVGLISAALALEERRKREPRRTAWPAVTPAATEVHA